MLAASAALPRDPDAHLREMALRLVGSRRRDAATPVIERICRIFGLPERLLTGESQAEEIVFPRQLVMYLLRKRGWSYPAIGRAIGGRHHTTVMSSVNRLETQRRRNAELDALLKELEARP